MIKFKKSTIILSVLTAFASSLCCIAPIIALLAGTSSLASNFSWIEPIRPYLVGLTFLILGFVWYQKLKPSNADCCQKTENKRVNFMQSKPFLGIMTIFALLLTTFPYYSNNLTAATPTENKVKYGTTTVAFQVSGMTCEGCEHHITSEINKLLGIQNVRTSYSNTNTTVEFDAQKININQIQEAINSTGYKVEEYKIIKK